jgi:hypothetical protein
MTRPYGHPPQVVARGPRGFSVLIDGLPMFFPFAEHPRLADVSPDQLHHIQRPRYDELHWPELGIKVKLERLRPLPSAPIPEGETSA